LAAASNFVALRIMPCFSPLFGFAHALHGRMIDGDVSMARTIMVSFTHLYSKSCWFSIASPLFPYTLGSKSIWLAIFSITGMLCYSEEDRDEVTDGMIAAATTTTTTSSFSQNRR
jgi:hypothetical protein